MRAVYAVFWREMAILRRRIWKTLISYAIGPALFLIAFGWGLGRSVSMEGVDYLTFMIPGLMSLTSMSQAWSIGMDINIARFYWMTFEEFQTAPLHHFSITLGEVLAGMVRGLLGAAIIALLALIGGVRIDLGPLLLLSLLLNTFVFAAASVVGGHDGQVPRRPVQPQQLHHHPHDLFVRGLSSPWRACPVGPPGWSRPCP